MTTHYEVEVIAANDHDYLRYLIREWLRKTKPADITHTDFAANGAEYTYCAMFIYKPREKPLPGRKRK